MQATISNSRLGISMSNGQNPNNNFFLKVLLFVLTLALIMQISGNSDAAAIGTVKSGSWSAPDTWDLGRIPTSADDVSINPKHDVTIADNVACSSLNFVNGGNSCSLTITGTYTLTVTNNVEIASKGSGANNMTFTIGNGNLLAGNILVNAVNGTKSAAIYLDNGNIVTNNFTFVNVTNVHLDITGTGILKIAGTLSLSGGIFNPGTSSTVIFNGTSPQTLPVEYKYAHVILDNPAGVNTNGAISPAIVNGNFTIKQGSFDNGGFNMVGATGKKLQVMPGCSLALSGTTGFPTGFSIISLDPNTTVIYQGSAQTISVQNYINLVVKNAGAKTLAGNLSIPGNLEIINAVFNLGSYTLSIEPSANITKASETGYITMGTGKLLIKNIGSGGRAGEVLFPVGLTSYNPAYVTNAGTADNFSVNLTDGVRNNANQLVTSHVVKKTWNLSKESNNGPSNVTLKLQWTAADEGTGFTRDACSITHYDAVSGFWTNTTFAPASGVSSFTASRSGITSFSPFGVGDASSPLPVELIYFKAGKQGETALLEWETAMEKNNQGFEVQLSSDGKTFESIGFVASRNPNSQTSQRYTFTDPQKSKTGLWYYRIKQTDLDGTVSFYGPKVVDFGKALNEIAAYPNPFSDQFQLKLQTIADSEANITICDLTGKTVYFATEKVKAGSNQILVKLNEKYPAGLYQLSARTPSQVYTTSLLKK